MYKIINKRELAPSIFWLRIEAPRVAATCQPGQFVIVRTDETGERIPLTIADFDRTAGTIDLVVQVVGLSTWKLAQQAQHDTISDVAGALGHPSEFTAEPLEEVRKRRYLMIAGGVGAAPVYPQAKWLHEHGITVDVIVGARNSELLILTDEMRAACDTLYICTDDGSAGFAGNVTGQLADLVERHGKHYDRVVTIGPMVMMKFVALATARLGIETIASLNTLMVDGTGMCGACRVSVGGQMRFACVDGPEFDAHRIDFDEAIRRNRLYTTQEREQFLMVNG